MDILDLSEVAWTYCFFCRRGRPKTEGTGAKPLIFPPPWGLYSFCLKLPRPTGGVSTPRSGLGLRMVKELDLQLTLGMNERRKTGSLPVYDMHRWGVGGLNLGQTQS